MSESTAVVPAAAPSTAIAPLAPLVPVLADDEIRRLWRLSAALAKSQMFKDVKQAEQAFAKVIIGRDLGLSPAQSMTALYLVEGKPQVAAPMLGHFIRSREGYDWKVIEHTAETCSIEFFRHGESQGVSTFTMEDAAKAKLDGKDVWKKYPRNMLFARAMSNGAKWYVPEATGGLPVYVEGELEGVGRAHDGGEGESAGETQESVAPTDLMAALEQAVDPNTERSVLEAALGAMVRSNALAPNSWTPSKVEMVFMGRGQEQVCQETEAIERANAELRARAAAEAQEGDGEQAEGGDGDEPQDAEVVPDAAPGDAPESLSDVESGRSEEHETKLLRIADLEDALNDGDALSDQERADIDAELDSIRGELPPEVNPGQGELPV